MPVPFAERSISLGLYVHNVVASARVDAMIEQAVTAVESGFDGVTVPEHHGGTPGYFPGPIQAAGWLLDAMPLGWAAPFPVLLPLRPTGLVIEEIAWLAARFPGRVGAAFGSGYLADDFEIAGTTMEARSPRFRAALTTIARAFGGDVDGPLAGDPAVAELGAMQVPLVGAVKGPRALELTARLGFGVCIPAVEDDDSRTHHDAYRAAGGHGPRITGRYPWLGDPSTVDSTGRSFQNLGRGDRSWGQAAELPLIADPDPVALAERLRDSFVASDATSLSLRFRFPAAPPPLVRDQIAAVGTEVLPRLRVLLAEAGGVNPERS